MQRLLILVLACALALPATPALGARGPRCTDKAAGARPFEISVQGEPATGHYALPAKAPKGLVVFSHGYGHTSKSWKVHLANAARQLRVVAVAMDYRGTVVVNPEAEIPQSRGWRVAEGAVDGIAAARHFERACPSIRTIVNFGVSMGGNTSGLMAAAGARRSNGKPLFDWWVDVEGATNVIETYLEAVALHQVNAYAAKAKADIEQEMGGTLAEKPEVYRERAVVTRADDIAASGVKGVVLVHGLDDGLVPYNQSREMAEALAAAGVGYDFYTVSRRDAHSEKDTTITGYAMSQLDPDYVSPLAGHASEKSTTHIVMRWALRSLRQLLSGGPRPGAGCRGEFSVDGGGVLVGGDRVCPP